ncbi:MAG: FKBP-type peptidyl-prolyl cis-trans isomerase [Patescibacteria group bacterium]
MAKVKEHSTRIFILVIVVVFAVSSLAFSGYVIWEIATGGDKKSATDNLPAEVQQKLNEQKAAQEAGENKLQGTQLADFTPVAKVEKLEVIDTQPGTGAEVKAGGKVTAHYTGAIASTGKIFQSSKDSGQPFTASLDGVIKGWQEGIPGMKAGGKRRIIIPASLAYGEQSPSADIPANSDLVFDIELIDVPQ